MHPSHVQQGHDHNPSHNSPHNSNPPPNNSQPHRNNFHQSHKQPVTVLGIPSVTVQNDQLLVGDSHSSQSSNSSIPHPTCKIIHLTFSPITQVQLALTPSSRSSVTAPLVQSGNAIGMGRYRPIHPSLQCSQAQVQGQNTQTRPSSLSNA